MNNGYGGNNHDHQVGHGHRVARLALSALLFASSAVLLGLTADRIHFTRTVVGRSEGIVDELLITSIISLISSLLLIHALTSTAIGFTRRMTELIILLVIWTMSLIGAVILTRNWHPLGPCGTVLSQCTIQKATIAFAWVVFGLTSLLTGLRLLNWHRDRYDGDLGGKQTIGRRGAGNATAPMTATGTGATV